jgi:hypothetical protein
MYAALGAADGLRITPAREGMVLSLPNERTGVAASSEAAGS